MTYPPDPPSQPASTETSPDVPLSVPPLPASEPKAYWRFMANRPSWKLSLLLIGLLLYAIAHHFWSASQPEERDLSEMAEKTQNAVRMTKVAFVESGMHYVSTEPTPPSHPGASAPSIQKRTTSRPGTTDR